MTPETSYRTHAHTHARARAHTHTRTHARTHGRTDGRTHCTYGRTDALHAHTHAHRITEFTHADSKLHSITDIACADKHTPRLNPHVLMHKHKQRQLIVACPRVRAWVQTLRLRELGSALQRPEYGGDASRFAAAAGGSAVALVRLVLEKLPGFRDTIV
jgi:hypothetical protein